MLSYSEEERGNGFVTHSSGNHAQAVALSSKIVNAKAHIVMPKGAPEIKVKAVKGYGAEVYLCDNNEKSRVETCNSIIQKTNANFIHPFDNEDVICGQATCAKEIYDTTNDLDFIMCPVGGGGDFGDWIKEAAVALVFAIHSDGGLRPDFDIGRMAQNAMIIANAEGLSSCPMTVYRQQELRDALSIPDEYDVPMVIGIGFPAVILDSKPPRSHPRIPIEDMVYRETWQDKT